MKSDFDKALRLLADKKIDYDKIVTKMPLEDGEYAFDNPHCAIKINLIP